MPEIKVSDMITGQQGYTLTWAMIPVDNTPFLYINGNYPVSIICEGNKSLRIMRTLDGVVVDKGSFKYPDLEYNYAIPLDSVPNHYIPVVGVFMFRGAI